MIDNVSVSQQRGKGEKGTYWQYFRTLLRKREMKGPSLKGGEESPRSLKELPKSKQVSFLEILNVERILLGSLF